MPQVTPPTYVYHKPLSLNEASMARPAIILIPCMLRRCFTTTLLCSPNLGGYLYFVGVEIKVSAPYNHLI